MYRTSKGMMVNFLEIDTGTESEAPLRSKLQRYRVWSESPQGKEHLLSLYQRHGAKEPRPVFRLLFIVSGNTEEQERSRIELLIELSGEVSSDLQRRVWICSGRELVHDLDASLPFERPVWLCGQDGFELSGKCSLLTRRRSNSR